MTCYDEILYHIHWVPAPQIFISMTFWRFNSLFPKLSLLFLREINVARIERRHTHTWSIVFVPIESAHATCNLVLPCTVSEMLPHLIGWQLTAHFSDSSLHTFMCLILYFPAGISCNSVRHCDKIWQTCFFIGLDRSCLTNLARSWLRTQPRIHIHEPTGWYKTVCLRNTETYAYIHVVYKSPVYWYSSFLWGMPSRWPATTRQNSTFNAMQDLIQNQLNYSIFSNIFWYLIKRNIIQGRGCVSVRKCGWLQCYC